MLVSFMCSRNCLANYVPVVVMVMLVFAGLGLVIFTWVMSITTTHPESIVPATMSLYSTSL